MSLSLTLLCVILLALLASCGAVRTRDSFDNSIARDMTTADPAALVHKSVLDYTCDWSFLYNYDPLPGGDSYHQSIRLDRLQYDDDGILGFPVQSPQNGEV